MLTEQLKPLTIFADLNGIVDMEVAVGLGFNGDIESGYVAPSFPIPKGHIYHGKPPGGPNIVVAEIRQSQDKQRQFYYQTFEGPDPIEMDNMDEIKAREAYNNWYKQIMLTTNPEFAVRPDELRTRLCGLLDKLRQVPTPTSST